MPEYRKSRRNISPFVERYRREYLAKGCTPRKADALAFRKAQRKRGYHYGNM